MRIDKNTKIYLGQTEIVKIKKGNVVIWESQSTPPVVEPDYFYIENTYAGTNTISLKDNESSILMRDLQYSKDKDTWTTFTPSTTALNISLNQGEKLYIRGSGNKGGARLNIIGSQEHIVGGNINTLIKYDDPNNVTLSQYAFSNLFISDTKLTGASNLTLPATTLANYCYNQMFYGCRALTTAPVLPATTLALRCYQNMFNNCTSLTTAPVLPATTLAYGCYDGMFSSCTSLTTASELPATTLSSSCYNRMFADCTSLVNAPELPAITLEEYCYYQMFSSCTSLTTAPELPATKLANYCYSYMFERCSALVNPPSILPGEFYYDDLNSYAHCYSYMFQYCTALETAPTLPATKLGEGCYQYMFNGCSSLATAPALPATTLANYCYEYMFSQCRRLNVAPTLPAQTLKENCYNEMFYGCSRLEQVITYANDISATDCITDWLSAVSESGTFYNLGTATYTQDSDSGIPQGWTEDTTAPVYYNYCAIPDTFTAKSWMDTVKITYGLYTFYNGNYVPISVKTVKTSIGKNTGNTTRTMRVSVQDSQLRTVNVTINQTANDTDEPDYLYIENNSDQDSLSLKVIGTKVDFSDFSKITESLEYSLDKNTWNSINFTGPITTELTVPVNGKVYFRNDTGKFGYYGYDTERYSITFRPQAYYSVGGDISTLLNYMDVEKTKPTDNGTFAYLFAGGDYLTDASNLKLQTTLPSKYCYYKMFNDCRALTVAPELPATTLKDSCYKNMFNGCTALTSTPALPATTLANYCYEGMFSNCSQLKNPPELPATTLAYYCYREMFNGCTVLTTAPELPATTLANYCYSYMFGRCSALVNPPALPATTLAINCYEGMFQSTALTSAPALPATTLANYCYCGMFGNCTSLTTAPELPATTLANNCYESMFSGCTSITTAPALPATTLANYCYLRMFYNCTSLTTAPALPATTLSNSCYKNMFNGCTSLNSVTILATSIGSDATANWLENVAAEGTFNNVGFATYTSGPSGIPSGWTEVVPTITSITASPSTYELKSYQNKVTANSTLTVVTNVGTFTMNDSQTITVGENTGDSTRTITETIPYKSSSYQITIVQTANDPKPSYEWNVESTGTYPFQLNSNDYYESTNKGHDNTYSYATLTYEGFNELVLQCINSGESYYDYGIISQPDVQLSESYSDDGATGSTNVFHNFKSESSTNPVQITIPSDGEEHFITIKFRKDSSSSQGNDSLQFKVIEPTT